MIVDKLAGDRVVAIALGLRAERTDHLRVAVVAALADIDVASGKLQCRVGLQAGYGLGDGFLKEQRDDLDQPADAYDQDDEHDHQADVFFDEIVCELHMPCPLDLVLSIFFTFTKEALESAKYRCVAATSMPHGEVNEASASRMGRHRARDRRIHRLATGD